MSAHRRSRSSSSRKQKEQPHVEKKSTRGGRSVSATVEIDLNDLDGDGDYYVEEEGSINDTLSVGSSINIDQYRMTAIDDEQLIEFSFRKTASIFSHWKETMFGVLNTITPLFFVVSMVTYILSALDGNEKTAIATAQVGVAFLLVWILVALLAVILGLPIVLMQRIVGSVTEGHSAELEIICLGLSIITIACVSVVVAFLREHNIA